MQRKMAIPTPAKSLPSNNNISDLAVDTYYHLGLTSDSPCVQDFAGVQFVLLCGSRGRAKMIADEIVDQYASDFDVPETECKVAPIGKTDRFVMYKLGHVVVISHGMGEPSISICLHEVTKLLAVARGTLDGLTFIRIGTSGGIGIEPGNVVVSTGAVNGVLEPFYEFTVSGKRVKRSCDLDKALSQGIARSSGDIKVEHGKTMSVTTFYEGQGRLDGAICTHSMDDKMEFLRKAHSLGVRNIEMEASCFAAFCREVNVAAAIVCVVLLNRLNGDQVDIAPEEYTEWTRRPLTVALRYIRSKCLDAHSDSNGVSTAASSKRSSGSSGFNADWLEGASKRGSGRSECSGHDSEATTTPPAKRQKSASDS